VDTLSYDKGKVRMESRGIQATYEAQFDEKAGEITGTWTQPGGSWPLTLSRAKPGDLATANPVAPKELEGRWTGTLKVSDQISFRLALRVEKEKADGPLKAVIDSLDQNVNGLPVTAVSLKKGQLSFENKGIAATFKGRLDEKAGEITGTWTQPGGSWPLTLSRAKPGDLATANPVAPKELEGRWTGTLKVSDEISFRLALRVEKEKAGGPLKAVIDSLDQNVNGLPVTAVSLQKGQLSFENKGIAATFKGRLDEKAGEITGTWTQPGGSWPLTLTKHK